MIIKGIKCPLCGDLIFSRCNHDFRHCSCGAIAIDGGRYNKETDTLTYSRVIFPDEVDPNVLTPIDIPDGGLTFKELYDDWNSIGPNKYGLIKPSK